MTFLQGTYDGGLAVSGSYAYAVAGVLPQSILRVPLDGSAPESVASAPLETTQILTDGSYLYWATSWIGAGRESSDVPGYVQRMRIDGQ
jgi:hypothetical protein